MKRAEITFESPDSEQKVIIKVDWDDEGDYSMNMKMVFEPEHNADAPTEFHTNLAFNFIEYMRNPKNH